MKKVKLAVNGTLMRGLALNRNLLEVGAKFLCEAVTAPCYRLWSIKDEYPAMLRDEHLGAPIRVEIWELTPSALIGILEKEPPGLSIGWIELADGELVLGVLGETYISLDQKEITSWGGWRNYMKNP